MTTKRESYEPWMEDYLRRRYPELEEPLLRAIDAFDAIQETGQITPDRLAPIIDAVQSSRGPLYVNASGLLASLTGQYPDACAALLALSQHPKSHVRFNAVISIGESTPRPLALQILRERLKDKSSRVRTKAADWIQRRRIRECIPDLEAALALETHRETLETIDFGLRLLRDGYILGEVRGERVSVWVLLPDDSQCSSMGTSIDQSELTKRGIEVIVQEIIKGKR